MSTYLSEKRFTDSAQNGAFSWLFEGFRTRLRDGAKFVRTEAAWKTWPAVHLVAKALHESLVTDGDTAAEYQDNLHALAERCTKFYPSEDRLGNLHDPKRQREVALTLGLGPNDVEQLNDALEVYRAEYAQPPEGKPEPLI